MFNELYSVVEIAGATFVKIIPITIALGVVFAVLTTGRPAIPAVLGGASARSSPTFVLVSDSADRALRSYRPMVIGRGGDIYDIHGTQALIDFYDDGHRPARCLPLWAAGRDLPGGIGFPALLDPSRLFTARRLWKYHAVHHSSEEVDWISAARFHPINLFLGTVVVDVVLLLAGISPNVMVWVGPFTTVHSGFVHANLNWTLGPFKYVLAGPVFHRWHHTLPDRGGNMNFAGTFPIWDLMFGTFYMPENELPDAYGIDDKSFPEGFGAQMLYPFTR